MHDQMIRAGQKDNYPPRRALAFFCLLVVGLALNTINLWTAASSGLPKAARPVGLLAHLSLKESIAGRAEVRVPSLEKKPPRGMSWLTLLSHARELALCSGDQHASSRDGDSGPLLPIIVPPCDRAPPPALL